MAAGSGIRSYNNGTLDIQDNLIQNNGEHGLHLFRQRRGNAHHQEQHFRVQYTLRRSISARPETLTLDGTQMSGNTASTNGTNGLRLAGTLTGTSTLRNPGLAFVLEEAH